MTSIIQTIEATSFELACYRNGLKPWSAQAVRAFLSADTTGGEVLRVETYRLLESLWETAAGTLNNHNQLEGIPWMYTATKTQEALDALVQSYYDANFKPNYMVEVAYSYVPHQNSPTGVFKELRAVRAKSATEACELAAKSIDISSDNFRATPTWWLQDDPQPVQINCPVVEAWPIDQWLDKKVVYA